MKRLALTMILTVVFCAVGTLAAPNRGPMKDPRDGKTYKTVQIGNQTWMAENLNYETEDSYCYKNDESNCSKYGRLYKWEVTVKACPAGWHLPSKEEFEILFKAVGGTQDKESEGENGMRRERG